MIDRCRQTGAALIVSLIMLLLLTVVGISSVRMTSLQERMAGNLQFRTKAFERAEEAARFAENEAENFGGGVAFTNTNGLYNSPANNGLPRWRAAGTSWRSAPELQGGNILGEYILESIGTVKIDPTCMTADCQYGTIYRVTARAAVENTGADVMIQTTYKAP